eukprot:UN31351
MRNPNSVDPNYQRIRVNQRRGVGSYAYIDRNKHAIYLHEPARCCRSCKYVGLKPHDSEMPVRFNGVVSPVAWQNLTQDIRSIKWMQPWWGTLTFWLCLLILWTVIGPLALVPAFLAKMYPRRVNLKNDKKVHAIVANWNVNYGNTCRLTYEDYNVGYCRCCDDVYRCLHWDLPQQGERPGAQQLVVGPARRNVQPQQQQQRPPVVQQQQRSVVQRAPLPVQQQRPVQRNQVQHTQAIIPPSYYQPNQCAPNPY